MKKSERHIFINGKIFTSDDRLPYADSMVVEAGRIVWIGTGADMPKEYAELIAGQPHTEDGCSSVTDLKGRRVIPGFVDAHMHPVMLADFRRKITAMPPEINSIEDLVEAVRKRREQQKAGEWIEGWGYDEQGLLEKRSPTRYDLDRGCSDSPVSIMRTCAHIRCVNSMALKLAGIDRNTPDPPGGEIERDENGEPTGVLKENARNLIVPLMAGFVMCAPWLLKELRQSRWVKLLALLGLVWFGAALAVLQWYFFSNYYVSDLPLSRSFAFTLPISFIGVFLIVWFCPVQPEKKWRGLTLSTINEKITAVI